MVWNVDGTRRIRHGLALVWLEGDAVRLTGLARGRPEGGGLHLADRRDLVPGRPKGLAPVGSPR